MHDETNDQENRPECSQPELNTPPIRSLDRPTLSLRKVTDVVDKVKAEVAKLPY